MEIRWSYDRLISTIEFPILVRHLYAESGPRTPLLMEVSFFSTNTWMLGVSKALQCMKVSKEGDPLRGKWNSLTATPCQHLLPHYAWSSETNNQPVMKPGMTQTVGSLHRQLGVYSGYISSKDSQQMPHSSTLKARYGASFMIRSNSEYILQLSALFFLQTLMLANQQFKSVNSSSL